MPKRKQWFTADLHLNHPNIIKYCARPWKMSEVKDMDSYLISKINELCSPNDVLYHLGDLMFPSGGRGNRRRTFEDYMEQINCTVVPLKGNHDKDNLPSNLIEGYVKLGREEVFISHMPKAVAKINLCGHEHGKFRIYKNGKQYVINVGVDAWNYQPIQLEDVKRIIQNHKSFFSGKDEHGNKVIHMPILNERWIKKAPDYDINSKDISDRHWVLDKSKPPINMEMYA